ncbi:MAG: hypothetical protein JXD19_11995 [Deltaproteobacteria bacterium]|nr:hypothetical protein [Deltaproteobacteria bacterium]
MKKKYAFGWVSIGMVVVLICGGCGRNKAYVPPDKGSGGTIVLVNPIYDPGFYVELDKKEAGFLKERLEIEVAPGKHTLKVYNVETVLADSKKIINHKFDLTVKIGQGEVQKIQLAWDDPSYSMDARNQRVEPPTEQRRNKNKEKRRDTMPGTGMP